MTTAESRLGGQGAQEKALWSYKKGGNSLFFIWFLSFIPLSEAGLREQVLEKVLPNGLKVLLLENHKAPVITFQVWYRVGPRNEEWGRTGLSHMLEHMMFKGTKRTSGREFSHIIQENGGNENAFTSQDLTAYFENLSADRVQVSLDLESNRMVNLILREEDFRTERMVVMEERRLRTDDNPQAYLLEQVRATAFPAQPYQWPTVRWMEDIARFTIEDLKAYHRTYYNPANAFGLAAKGRMRNQVTYLDPPQAGERRIRVKREAQVPVLVMGFPVPNLRDPDSYVLVVVANLEEVGMKCSTTQWGSLVQEMNRRRKNVWKTNQII